MTFLREKEKYPTPELVSNSQISKSNFSSNIGPKWKSISVERRSCFIIDAFVIFSNWRAHKQKLILQQSEQKYVSIGILQALGVEMADMEGRVFTIVFPLWKWMQSVLDSYKTWYKLHEVGLIDQNCNKQISSKYS